MVGGGEGEEMGRKGDKNIKCKWQGKSGSRVRTEGN